MNDVTIDYSLDNIPISIFEAENVRYKINILFKIKQVVLVEVFTGNVYKYHAVNYLTKDKKYLFFTKQAIPQSKHEEVAERIMKLTAMLEMPVEEMNNDKKLIGQGCIKNQEDTVEVTTKKPGTDYVTKTNETKSHVLLDRIFRDVLPRYGFTIRESQIELADIILKALQECKISLCEAEVGTGKTHAYIIAAILNKLDNKNFNRIRTSYPGSFLTLGIYGYKKTLAVLK